MKPFLTQTQKQKQYIYLVQSNHSIDGGKLPLFCDHKTEDSFTCPKSNKHVNGVRAAKVMCTKSAACTEK